MRQDRGAGEDAVPGFVDLAVGEARLDRRDLGARAEAEVGAAGDVEEEGGEKLCS